MEDQFKKLFDEFTPEVRPEVWNRLSDRLAAAKAPQKPANGNGLTKIIQSSSAVKIALLAGAALTASLIYSGIKYYSHGKQPGKTENVIPVPAQTSPSINNPGTSAGAVSSSIVNTPAEKSNAGKDVPLNVSATKTDVPVNAAQTSPVINAPSIIHNTPANPDNSPAAPAVIKPVTDQHPLTAASPVAPAAGMDKNPDLPLTLILNTRGGFAPLNVTVMTNQEDRKADFDFGDGTQVNAQSSVTHRYESAGNYTVHCTAGDRSTEQTIEVIGQLPTAFSPNGDGINDQFIAGDEQVISVNLKIFTREGKIIYRNSGRQVKWDGLNSDNTPAETGTYFYDIFVTSQKGVTYQQKGTINLFR